MHSRCKSSSWQRWRLTAATLAIFVLLFPHRGYGDSFDIVLIVIDDLNDWIGALGGHPQVQTPNIDELASRGMSFTNAHAPAPQCNASRTAFLTGLSPSSSGVYDNRSDWRELAVFEGKKTLPAFFRSHGFGSYGAGKVFHAHTFDAEAFHGFNDPNAWDGFYPSVDRQLPEEVVPAKRPANGNPITQDFDWAPLSEDAEEMADSRVVSWAVSKLLEDSDSPRFFAVGIYRPHLPWYTPKKFFELYPIDDTVLPEVPNDDLGDVPGIGTMPFLEMTAHPPMKLHQWVVENNLWQQGVQAYLASVSYADAEVGRILQAIEESGRADNTIVVLVSDHGFHLGEKHRWRKQTLWEESTQVPFIVVAPGVTTPGTSSSEPVSLMDLYSTLAELTSLKKPSHVEGSSLMPLLKDPSVTREHPALTTSGFRNHSVRNSRYRYTRYSDRSEELYDLQKDPNEWENLADDPDYESIKRGLAEWLPERNARPQR